MIDKETIEFDPDEYLEEVRMEIIDLLHEKYGESEELAYMSTELEKALSEEYEDPDIYRFIIEESDDPEMFDEEGFDTSNVYFVYSDSTCAVLIPEKDVNDIRTILSENYESGSEKASAGS